MTEPAHTISASFGFREVPEGERQGLVNEVFATVAERYDLMNDLMSGGLHRLWKADLIAMLNPPRGEQAFRLVDVAGGTGDVAIRFADSAGKNSNAVVCDINPKMLEVGKRRIEEQGLSGRIATVEGNAEALPFEVRDSTPIRSPSEFAMSRTSTRRFPRHTAC